MENKIIFATRLKEIRQELHKTQKEFAEFVNSTPATISAYENGSKNPSLEIVINIAKECNVSIDWLCGLSENKTPGKTFDTYRDIVNILFELDKYVAIVFAEDNENNHQNIGFDDYLINEFLQEWRDATSVLYNTSINKEITKTMYDSWERSKLEEFSKKKLKKKKRKD